MDHLRSEVGDQPGQYVETSSLLKIQKLAGMVAHAFSPSSALKTNEEESLEPERPRLQ